MPELRLTAAARADFIDIGRYTQGRWGRGQRVAYLADLVAAFGRLAETPDLARPRDDIKPGLRSYRCGQHVIFCRVQRGVVEVLRILHGRQSVERMFGGG